MKNFEPDDFDAKLRAWKVEPAVPASFQREVWQRIAARQALRSESLWPRVAQWWLARLVRPQYATALVIFSLAGSVGAAHMQAQDARAKLGEELEERYAASVDPLTMMSR